MKRFVGLAYQSFSLVRAYLRPYLFLTKQRRTKTLVLLMLASIRRWQETEQNCGQKDIEKELCYLSWFFGNRKIQSCSRSVRKYKRMIIIWIFLVCRHFWEEGARRYEATKIKISRLERSLGKEVRAEMNGFLKELGI